MIPLFVIGLIYAIVYCIILHRIIPPGPIKSAAAVACVLYIAAAILIITDVLFSYL